MDSPDLTIVIPERNEAKTLPLTLIDADRYLSKGDRSYEIIVVDSASTDSTGEIVRRFSSFIKNLKLIELKRNFGEGFAVRKGMLEASGKLRLLLNPWSRVHVKEVEKILPEFKAGFGAVIGNYVLPSGMVLKPSRTFGFGCFSAAAAERIFPMARINGSGYGLEILELARRTGVRVSGVKVEAAGKPFHDFLGGFRSLKDAVKIKFWLLSGAYKV